MDLLNNLLETCTALTRRVKNLKQDKIAQSLEIIKLKKRVRKLEKKRKLKVSRLKRLRKDVTLEEVDVEKNAEVEKNADVQGRLKESQDKVYHIDVEHADKVLSMQDDKTEPAKLQEVIEVVTTTKLMTEVVTAATTLITATTITAASSAARRKKGVMIKDPEEIATPSTIIHYEPKSKDKGKEIMDDVIEQVQRKEKEDNVMLRYQALKRKPQTEAYARKNMMIYLKNMVGFKMEYFKGISFDDIRPIFKKYFNSNVAILVKSKEELEEEESRSLKRKISESQEEKASKKKKLVEEVILLVERRYPLTRFTLEKMLKNVRNKLNCMKDGPGGQENAIDEDVDEQPVHDLALNVDNVFQADDCDAFDSDVDEALTTQTMFMANLSSADPVYDEAGPSYDSNILFK
nr:integrase, catalytic region, zinc finger, CCHC-type, peptidase aspartic, catalytic [Tanacetum cinerariifolium]